MPVLCTACSSYGPVVSSDPHNALPCRVEISRSLILSAFTHTHSLSIYLPCCLSPPFFVSLSLYISLTRPSLSLTSCLFYTYVNVCIYKNYKLILGNIFLLFFSPSLELYPKRSSLNWSKLLRKKQISDKCCESLSYPQVRHLVLVDSDGESVGGRLMY